jgi:hypothetical protein
MRLFDETLLEAVGSPDSPRLSEVVRDTFPHDPRAQLNVWTVVATEPPAGAITGLMPSARHRGTVGNVDVFEVGANPKNGPFVVATWPTYFPGVYHLISTVPTTDKRWLALVSATSTRRSGVVTTFLDTDDFVAINEHLTQFGPVEVSRVTARWVDRSSYSRGFPQHRPSLARALGDLRGASIRTLTLHVGTRLVVHLRRSGGVSYYSGEFRLFEQELLTHVAKSVSDRWKLVSGRAREAHQPVSDVVTLRLPQDFSEGIATEALVNAVRMQTRTALAIVHGNPYVQLAVTDMIDGSNFDLFVTTGSDIKIVPGYRATGQAIMRLAQGLSDHLAADRVEAGPLATAPSEEDLLSPT